MDQDKALGILLEEVEKSKLETELKPPGRIVHIAGQRFEQREHSDLQKIEYCELAILEAMTVAENQHIANPEELRPKLAAIIGAKNRRVALALGCPYTFVFAFIPQSLKEEIVSYQDRINGLPQLFDVMKFHQYILDRVMEKS